MKLLIATPTYDGGVRHADALVQLYMEPPHPKEVATFRPQGSLLTLLRNQAWCQALNDGCTHLLFLDADVDPQDATWFQVLYDEMQRSGADILGASVALKDPSGETSIAMVGDDIFDPQRYSIEYLAEQERTIHWNGLVVATGCMLIDLSGAWVWKMHGPTHAPFSMTNSIMRDDGKLRADIVPEDYNFCWQARRHGATIAATTAIKTLHWDGGTAYPNWL